MKENYLRFLKRNLWWFLILVIAKLANSSNSKGFGFLEMVILGLMGLFIVSGVQWILWGTNYKKRRNIKELINQLLSKGLIVENDIEDLTERVYEIVSEIDTQGGLLDAMVKNRKNTNVSVVLSVINELCFHA